MRIMIVVISGRGVNKCLGAGLALGSRLQYSVVVFTGRLMKHNGQGYPNVEARPCM